MKIKTDNIEFISFSDGICNIYSIDDNENKTDKYTNLAFSERVLGYKKFFAAQANKVQVDRVIRTPQLKNVNGYDFVEVSGDGKYEIKMTQNIYDTNPPCTDLTLKRV